MDTQAVTVPQGEATAAALAVRELAEVRGAMTIAREFPRNEITSREKMELSASRQAFADMAEYSFTRGGKPIVGGSVYLAREMARSWGNIVSGFQELPTGEPGTCHLEGYARDNETNACVRLQDRFPLRVQRKVWNEATRQKETMWVTPDDRDARELKNKRGAILMRNCIFSIMPPDLVEDVIAACRATNEKAADGELAEDRPKVIRALCTTFGKIGVSTELLEKHLGHSIAGLQPEELAELRGIWKSISTGETQLYNHFDVDPPKTDGKDDLDAELGGDKKPEGKPAEKTRKKRGITKVQLAAFRDMFENGEVDESMISPHLPDDGDTALDALATLTQEEATPLLKRAMGGEFKPAPAEAPSEPAEAPEGAASAAPPAEGGNPPPDDPFDPGS